MAKRPAQTQTNTKAKEKPRQRGAAGAMRRKLIAFDAETWDAIDLLARDRMMTVQEVAEEAFRDLLRKHGRPLDLKDALRKSARAVQKR
jgi:hypothetical protein